MGGGKDKKKTNAMIDTDRSSALGEHSKYMGTVDTGLAGATQRASDMYGVQYGGFKDFSEGKYNFNSPDLNLGGQWGGGGGGGGGSTAGDPRGMLATDEYKKFLESGGVNRDPFDQHQKNLLELGVSGGWSPETIASMQQNIAGFKDIGATGGIDAAGQARMRGNGMFEEWQKTGGVTEFDKQNMRARGNSVIPAFYKTAQDEANRMGAIQGGYGPGRTAMMGRLGREQAISAQGAARDTELGIANNVRQGQMWGGENVASSEGALQGLLTSNKLAGLRGASDVEGAMTNDIASNRMGASNMGAGNELGFQGLLQRGKMFGTEGLAAQAEQEANRAAMAGAAAAARGDYNRQWEAEFNAGNRLAGLQGMNSLYGSRPEEVNMYLDANRQGRDLIYGQQANTYDARIQNNKSNWAQNASTLMGGAGGLLGGVGSFFNKIPGGGGGDGGYSQNAYDTTDLDQYGQGATFTDDIRQLPPTRGRAPRNA